MLILKNLNDMAITFLMIGRLLYDKGYKEYVEAAKMVKQQYPDTVFNLLGGIDNEYPNAVPESEVLRDNDSGIINYLGFRKDVRNIINKADCIVLPSFYNEGLSRVLMEGLAMSKPIITTDMPGCKETVEDGINGFLCKPRDSISLANCCLKFLALKAEERILMGQYSRIKAEREFDIKDVIAVYDGIIKPHL